MLVVERFVLHDRFKLGAVHVFVFHQEPGNFIEPLRVRLEDLLAAAVSFAHDAVHLHVDLSGGLFGIGLCFFIVPADEDLLTGGIGDRADGVGHAVFCDHVARDGGGPLQIVGCTGGNVTELQRLRHAAAEERDDRFKHLVAGRIRFIVLRQADRHAAGLCARDDRDQVDRILRVEAVHADRVTGLVNS